MLRPQCWFLLVLFSVDFLSDGFLHVGFSMFKVKVKVVYYGHTTRHTTTHVHFGW